MSAAPEKNFTMSEPRLQPDPLLDAFWDKELILFGERVRHRRRRERAPSVQAALEQPAGLAVARGERRAGIAGEGISDGGLRLRHLAAFFLLA